MSGCRESRKTFVTPALFFYYATNFFYASTVDATKASIPDSPG